MLSFQLQAVREGPLVFIWRDNRDREYTGSTEIKFAAA